jgi:phosphatidate cytidylyltransferase
MAFNWQTFRTRTLTSLIFVGVMLAGLLWNQWSFLALFSVIHFGCWWEYLKLTEKIHQTTFHPYTKMGLMVMGYGLMLWFCGPSFEINGYRIKENISLPVSAAGFAILVIGIFQKNAILLKAFGMAAGGLIYISLSLGLLTTLYEYSAFRITWSIPIVLILLMWINDTMAYLIGSLMGKTPLTKISPKKTWEGTIGGIVLAALIASTVAWALQFSILQIAIAAIIGCVAGVFGDLFESKLKRMAGVKDSGSLMPGHGGFLDRFDSLLFAAPAFWLFLYLI